MSLQAPPGYRVVETDEIVDDRPVELYLLPWLAWRRADQGDERRVLLFYRYDVERCPPFIPSSAVTRRQWLLWRIANLVGVWAVVLRQNRLEPVG